MGGQHQREGIIHGAAEAGWAHPGGSIQKTAGH